MKPLESLVRSYVETHPEGAAHALEQLDAGEAAKILEKMPSAAVGPVVERLTPTSAAAILDRLGVERTRQLLEGMSPRYAAVALHHLEESRREMILTTLPEQTARRLRDLLRYAPDTAGGMMDPQVTAIPIDLTVQEGIAALRKAPRQTLYYLYVTEREGRLIGVLSMRELLLAMPKDPVQSLVHREVVSVAASTDREEVATLMRQRRFLALPVVDGDGRLVGVVKHDQVLHAVQEEAFEDLQRMVGAGGDERAGSPVGEVVKRRLPWLYVNLLTAFLAAAVVGLFEDVIAKVTALAVLLPIVAGQAGNSGAQALAVVIRGMALREVEAGRRRRLLWKETIAGLLNGAAIAAVTAGVVYLWDGRGSLALVIGLAMVVNMAAAGFAGAAIPLLLKAMGRDPAQSSSIFLTTVTDVVGFGSFLGFAMWLV